MASFHVIQLNLIFFFSSCFPRDDFLRITLAGWYSCKACPKFSTDLYRFQLYINNKCCCFCTKIPSKHITIDLFITFAWKPWWSLIFQWNDILSFIYSVIERKSGRVPKLSFFSPLEVKFIFDEWPMIKTVKTS